MVLTSHVEQPAVTKWRHELVTWLRNVSLLERPVQAITLTSTVQTAVRARLRQYEVRALLEAQQRASLELESLVLARTRQLEAANDALRTEMAERTRIEDSLRQAQRIEAIGQLTGGVAHDFNNLLMVILGGLEMFDRHADPERRKLLMDGMRQAAQRGAAVTRQLLAFSRRQPLQSQSVDLAHHIGGMRELLNRSLRGDVHVELDFAEDLWRVEVDPGELELVVLNLAVNARDAMPTGGYDHHPGRERAGDRARGSARRLRALIRHRYRHRNRAGGEGSHLRAVLHDKGGRQRIGSRPGAGVRFREAIAGRGQRRLRGRPRHERGLASPAFDRQTCGRRSVISQRRKHNAGTRTPPAPCSS